jgi:hypothetical protein
MLQQQRQQSQTRVRPCQGLKPGHDTCPGYASVRMYVWFTSQVVVNLCALLREQRSALERCVLLQLYTSAALCEPPKTRGTVALHAAYSTSSAIVDEVHLLPTLTLHQHGQPRVGDAGRQLLCNSKEHLITESPRPVSPRRPCQVPILPVTPMFVPSRVASTLLVSCMKPSPQHIPLTKVLADSERVSLLMLPKQQSLLHGWLAKVRPSRIHCRPLQRGYHTKLLRCGS